MPLDLNKKGGGRSRKGLGRKAGAQDPCGSHKSPALLAPTWGATHQRRHGSLAELVSKKRPELSSKGPLDLVGLQRAHRCQPVLLQGPSSSLDNLQKDLGYIRKVAG